VRNLQTKIADLEQEIEDKSLWALSLKQQLAEQTARAERLDLELYKLIHNPLHLAARLLTGIRNRFRSMFG
jgi:chromosome segregation ATPase